MGAEWDFRMPLSGYSPSMSCFSGTWICGFQYLFPGRSSNRQDLCALISTGVVGLVQSHPTVAMWSLHQHYHFHPKALQITELCRAFLTPVLNVSFFNTCLSWINARGLKKMQVHKSSLARKSYFQHPKRCLNWVVAPAEAGTSIWTVELSHFLGCCQRPQAWDKSTDIRANVKPQCLIRCSPQTQPLDGEVGWWWCIRCLIRLN